MNSNVNKIVKTLYKEGYCVVNNVLAENLCNKLISSLEKLKNKISKNKYFKDEHSKSGQVIIRDLILRDPQSFLPLIDNGLIINVLKKIFNDTFIIDNCMASNSILVKQKYKSLAHIDSHLPSKNYKHTSDVVVMYCFNDFNKKNGATKIWPGSHLSGIRVQNEKKYFKDKKNKFKYATAPKGSLVFFLGQTWHQIGQNLNGKKRWGILCHYKRWWIKPSTDFTKCGSKIFKSLNNTQKELFGFNSISPKYNFKKQTKNLKTLRKVKDLSNKYLKVLQY